MPFPPRHSPVTGKECPVYFVHSDSPHFRDVHGRVLILRGVNLSSSAKLPVGQPLEKQEDFWESAENGTVDFVGRVLNIENGDADIHLSRLKHWGYNCVRYVTVWEAIEHAGPGKYDKAYLDYTVALLRKCKEYGFKVVMDPHQDLFSRFSGGSGAPYWALLACGFNPRNFTATCASVIECEWEQNTAKIPMIWATNYERLAAQTLTTLFFGGRDFAPKCIIDGKNIQDWLQDHFIAAYRALADHIGQAGDLYDECVIGWDSINEPNHGFINLASLNTPHDTPVQLGPSPTPIQRFRLGVGEAMTVDTYKFGPFGFKKNGQMHIDPKGRKSWLEEGDEEIDDAAGVSVSKWGWRRDLGWKLGECLWAQHGVWDPQTGNLLLPDYFALKGKSSSFVMNYWLPFWIKWAAMIREVHVEAIHFVHTTVFDKTPPICSDSRVGELLKSRASMSYHFYDGLTLVSRKWNWYNCDTIGYLRGKHWTALGALVFGEKAIRKCLRNQLKMIKNDTKPTIGNYPSFFGEIGVPYDLDDKAAYKSGDYSSQTKAWDASMNALDGENALNYAMWCYCPDNSHKWGDHWNGEDLSIWSKDDAKKNQTLPSKLSNKTSLTAEEKKEEFLNNGGRSLEAICRPYPRVIVGNPIAYEYSIESSEFSLQVEVGCDDVIMNEKNELSTEIYVPKLHYGIGKKSGSSTYYLSSSSLMSKEDENDSLIKKEKSAQSEYALSVQISGGRWELDEKSQVVRWYYAIPEKGKRKYEITIKRAGGSLYASSNHKSHGRRAILFYFKEGAWFNNPSLDKYFLLFFSSIVYISFILFSFLDSLS